MLVSTLLIFLLFNLSFYEATELGGDYNNQYANSYGGGHGYDYGNNHYSDDGGNQDCNDKNPPPPPPPPPPGDDDDDCKNTDTGCPCFFWKTVDVSSKTSDGNGYWKTARDCGSDTINCGDTVTYIVKVQACSSFNGAKTASFKLSFNSGTISNTIGYSGIVTSARLNTGDPNMKSDGGSVVSSNTKSSSGFGLIEHTVTVTDIEQGEVIIVRVDVQVCCQQTSSSSAVSISSKLSECGYNSQSSKTCQCNTAPITIKVKPYPSDSLCSDSTNCCNVGQFAYGPQCHCTSSTKNCDDHDACTTDSCDAKSGKCVNTPLNCDDSNACTVDNCDCSGKCTHISKNCDDCDACTSDSCDAKSGKCVHTTVTCNDNNACTTDVCDSYSGKCLNLQKVCNDQNPCTVDTCSGGNCVYTPNTCNDNNACTNDNCNAYDGTCIYTPINCDDDNKCTQDSCAYGQCTHTPKNCDDGQKCTVDSCEINTGNCTHVAVYCDDNVDCTDDVCRTSDGACVFTPNDSNCPDQRCQNKKCDAVNGCQYTPTSTCPCQTNSDCHDDGVACTRNTCDTSTGSCSYIPDDTLCPQQNCKFVTCTSTGCVYSPNTCDDYDACTADSCDYYSGNCINSPISCDDNNACTPDSCDENIGCIHGQPPSCDDYNACTADSCDTNTGDCVHVSKICDDNDPCTSNNCDINTGNCYYVQMNCNDNNACTTDSCAGGICYNIPVVCNDNNPCTIDTCNNANGSCIYTPLNCNDNNPCTSDSCVNGICVQTPIVCNDNNPCTTDSCNVTSGDCIFTAIVCNDNNPCTTDSCDTATGICAYSPVDCNDFNQCTIDTCDLSSGQCVHTSLNCDDGIGCTNDSCDSTTGLCTHVPVDSVCNTNDLCVSYSCSPTAGCVYVSKNCADQYSCTIDTCNAGNCIHTPTNSLCGPAPDNCTDVTCNPADSTDSTGCVQTTKDCDDGVDCTFDACGATGCSHSPQNGLCSASSPCFIASCDLINGCVQSPKNCNDCNPCTSDSCFGGVCSNVVNTALCNDGLKCTTDTCIPETDASGVPLPNTYTCQFLFTASNCGKIPSCQTALCSSTTDCSILYNDALCPAYPNNVTCLAPSCQAAGCTFVDICSVSNPQCGGCSDCACNVVLNKCVKTCPSKRSLPGSTMEDYIVEEENGGHILSFTLLNLFVILFLLFNFQ